MQVFLCVVVVGIMFVLFVLSTDPFSMPIPSDSRPGIDTVPLAAWHLFV